MVDNSALLAELGGLDVQSPVASYPRQIKGRIAHIDADFMSYQVSAESKAELNPDDLTPRKTLEDMKDNAVQALEHVRRRAGAEFAVCHVTTDPTKGGRDKFASIKEYQCGRKDRSNKPENLDAIRQFIAALRTPTLEGREHADQEADDGMAQALYADEKAILCSADKDLLMVPGLKLDMQTGDIWTVDRDKPFGWIEYDAKKRKIIGGGTKFFWAQLLMGDKADDIPGVPECPGDIWQLYAGTKKYKELRKKWIDADDAEEANKVWDKLTALEQKTKLCGPKLTYDILCGVHNDEEAFRIVQHCYVQLQEKHGYTYTHWKTGKTLTARQVMASHMLLLWMRRNKDPKDVFKWIKERIDEWNSRR